MVDKKTYKELTVNLDAGESMVLVVESKNEQKNPVSVSTTNGTEALRTKDSFFDFF